jgi:histidinol-phosphate aminotransferase
MKYEMSERNKKLKSYPVTGGSYSVYLDANESFIDPVCDFKDEIIDAIKNIPLNRYPEDSSFELRQTFGALYGVNPSCVIAGNGSDELIAMIIGSFLFKDESFVASEPDFSMYKIFAGHYGRKISFAPKKSDYSIDPKKMIEAVEENGARLLIFSNPGSYGGKTLKKDDVLYIAKNTQALVVVDEAYMDFSDQSVLDVIEDYSNILVLKTCSKAISCAALRIGFAVSSKKIIDVLNSLRPPYNVNSLSQAVGKLILSKSGYLKANIERLKKNRDDLFDMLLQFKGENTLKKIHRSDANFILIESDLRDYIFEELKRRSILVRLFESGLRITVGSEKDNRILIAALKEILTRGGK